MTKARPILITIFWLGVVFFALGQIITFYPGAETAWFLITSIMLAIGLLIRRGYRIAAGILLCLSIAAAITGYKRGSDYQEWLSNRPAHGDRKRK